ncbi:MAG: DNA-directed RNA polymerase subunit B'', partial [Thermoplasmata archaeon]|nr:DNA-directed RNA polymerase subunit B'' [Thermoplasmata archaeon]
MRELVRAFFRERSIVNHQIASFNDFIRTPENINSRMQRILDEVGASEEPDERGYFKLDPDRTGDELVIVRYGRERTPEGEIDPKAPNTVALQKPQIKEANGATRYITPMEARLRNFTYQSPIEAKFTITKIDVPAAIRELEAEFDTKIDMLTNEHIHYLLHNEEILRKCLSRIDEEKVTIGYLPIMVKSRQCNLHPLNIREDGTPVTDPEEYAEALRKEMEDPCDPGGYFIIGGTERVLISLEDLAPNKVMVEYNERYGTRMEVGKVFSQREGYRALTLMEKKKDGILEVSVPAAPTNIPLVVLMKALAYNEEAEAEGGDTGSLTDQEIFEAIVSEPEMENIVLANIEDSHNPKNYPPDGIHTPEDAWNYLERKFAMGQAKEYRVKKVRSIIDRSLLPHLGVKREDRQKKIIFLGRMARSVLELHLGKRPEDDKDHYANKRLKLAGDLMEDLFRTSFSALIKDLKYQLERNYNPKKPVKISSTIRSDMFSQRIYHAMSTGNWVGGRTGVSQLLDRTSNMSTISHLRRVTSPLTRSQPHFEARDLHATQWGRLCPNETPEGQNCGLVKNYALIVDVSEGVDERPVKQLLMDSLGCEPVKGSLREEMTKGKVYLNGDLVGLHAEPEVLVAELRKRRRRGEISHEVNVRYDPDMNEVIINCDAGRLRRPLLIVEDGDVNLTKKMLEEIERGEIKISKDLFT